MVVFILGCHACAIHHPNALVQAWQSVEAFIAVVEVVQMEVGTPVPGTYSHD